MSCLGSLSILLGTTRPSLMLCAASKDDPATMGSEDLLLKRPEYPLVAPDMLIGVSALS